MQQANASLRRFAREHFSIDLDSLTPTQFAAYAPQIAERLRDEISATGQFAEIVKSAVEAAKEEREAAERRRSPVLPALVRDETLRTVSSKNLDLNSVFDGQFPIEVE